MAVHTELTSAEAADRLAIRELFDAYAHCADRRDAEGQKALFTADTRFAVFMGGEGSEPTYVLEGREALAPVFADLNRYEATTHFNGQSTVTVDGDRATGESYTIAHHLFTEDGARKIIRLREPAEGYGAMVSRVMCWPAMVKSQFRSAVPPGKLPVRRPVTR